MMLVSKCALIMKLFYKAAVKYELHMSTFNYLHICTLDYLHYWFQLLVASVDMLFIKSYSACSVRLFFFFSARTGNNNSANNLPDIAPVNAVDTQWVEVTSKKAALKLEKLDTDLKNYKSNSIKESIRLVSKWLCDVT